MRRRSAKGLRRHSSNNKRPSTEKKKKKQQQQRRQRSTVTGSYRSVMVLNFYISVKLNHELVSVILFMSPLNHEVMSTVSYSVSAMSLGL